MNDLTPDEQRIADAFSDEHAPDSVDQWHQRAARRFGRGPSWVRPVAALATVAVVAGGLGSYFGIRAHFASSGAGGPAAYPAARSDAAMAYDPSDGNVVMFGGFDNAGHPLGDTWTWDGSNWSQQHPATSPPPLSDAVMAYDPSARELVLFGGSSLGPFAGTSGSGCAVILPAPAVSGVPGVETTAMPIPARPSVPDCTPSPAPAPAAATWTWNGSTWRHAASGGPAFELGRTWSATDPAANRVLLVSAGWDWGSPAVLCAAGIPCHGPGPAPPAVQTWSWDHGKWQRIQAAFPATPASDSYSAEPLSLVTDPVSGHLALVSQSFPVITCDRAITGGPSSAPAPCPEAMKPQAITVFTEWNGTGWGNVRQVHDASGPPFAGPLAFDPSIHALVFIGPDPAAAPRDSQARATWLWNGSWSKVAAGSTPPTFGGGAITYDAQSSQVVLFGGLGLKTEASGANNLPVRDDMWTFDGSKWTRRGGTPPATTPSAPQPPSPLPIPPCPALASPPNTGTIAPLPLPSCPIPGGTGGGFSGGSCSASWSGQPGPDGSVDLTLTAAGPSPQCVAGFRVVDAKGSPVGIRDGTVQVDQKTVYEVWSNWCGGSAPLYMEDVDPGAAAPGKGPSQWVVTPPSCTDVSKPSAWTLSAAFDGCPPRGSGQAGPPGLKLEPACPIPVQNGPPLSR